MVNIEVPKIKGRAPELPSQKNVAIFRIHQSMLVEHLLRYEHVPLLIRDRWKLTAPVVHQVYRDGSDRLCFVVSDSKIDHVAEGVSVVTYDITEIG